MIENGNIAYSMPQEIKDELTNDFLETFLGEIHKIFGFSIQEFADEQFWYLESTGGWNEAFVSACRRLNKEKLLLYYMELEWYDSDVFDGQLTDILIDRKYILPSIETHNFLDIIAKENNMNKNDILFCSMCENAFDKRYLKVYNDGIDDNEDDKNMVCPHCYESLRNVRVGGKTEPEKFEEDLPKIQPLAFNRKEIILQNLRYTAINIFECPQCKKYHPISNRATNGICFYCCLIDDLNQKPQTNAYYKEICSINQEYITEIKHKYGKN